MTKEEIVSGLRERQRSMERERQGHRPDRQGYATWNEREVLFREAADIVEKGIGLEDLYRCTSVLVGAAPAHRPVILDAMIDLILMVTADLESDRDVISAKIRAHVPARPQ